MATTVQTAASLEKPMEEVDQPAVIPTMSKVIKKPKTLGTYYQAVLARRISVGIGNVGGNMRQILENVAEKTFAGKCGPEGYIKPGSVKIQAIGAPILKADTVMFQVTLECLICNPVEGMIVNCVVKNVTKAGIRAEVPEGADGQQTPMVIFISRDHHYNDAQLNNIAQDDNIQVKVIGSRFMLNDKYVSVIAQLVDKPTVVEKPTRAKTLKRPKLVLKSG